MLGAGTASRCKAQQLFTSGRTLLTAPVWCRCRAVARGCSKPCRPPPLWPLTRLVLLRSQVMRRYHIQDRDDYKKYNKLCGMVTKLVATLKRLDARDTTRIELTDQLLNK